MCLCYKFEFQYTVKYKYKYFNNQNLVDLTCQLPLEYLIVDNQNFLTFITILLRLTIFVYGETTFVPVGNNTTEKRNNVSFLTSRNPTALCTKIKDNVITIRIL